MKLRANPRIPLALLAILLASIPSMGWCNKTDDEIACLRRQNWDERISIQEFMKCDAALTSLDGCRLNIEKACINGVEVDLAKDPFFLNSMSGIGFRPQASNGVKRSDFVDPS